MITGPKAMNELYFVYEWSRDSNRLEEMYSVQGLGQTEIVRLVRRFEWGAWTPL